MTTKTKKEVISRWRPKKSFDSMPKKSEDTEKKNIGRGRPKKERTIDDSVNTKINHKKKEISQLEKKNKEISESIKSSSFSTRTLNTSYDTENKQANNFTLCLLILSMMFFIFAVYKTFYVKPHLEDDLIITWQDSVQTMETTEWNIDLQWSFWPSVWDLENSNGTETANTIGEDNKINSNVWNIDNWSNTLPWEIVSDETLIKNFYGYINNRDFNMMNSSVDQYLKSSNTFRTYFNQNWLNRYLDKLSQNKVFVSNIKKISGDENSTRYYSYDIKYVLKETSWLVTEQWEAAIVKRWDKTLIWSIRCITTWCSRMPFFQP